MATEVANAYVAIYTKMPGVAADIEKSLGGSDVQKGAKKSGKGIGGKLLGGLGAVVKGGAIAIGATMAAGIGVSLVKGFGRLGAIDAAEKKLTGLGNSAKDVDEIMVNALASVKGTAFGLGDAATVAASLVAAQIKPGKELEGVMKSVANTAAAANVPLEDMGSIYSKVASLGKAQNDSLQQVANKGLPIYQALSDQLGVTTEEVFKMASAGEIGFADFEKAMTTAAGTVAEEMGKTLPGATANFFASLGRIGANLFSEVYPMLAPLMIALTGAFGPIEDIAKDLGKKLGDFIGPGIQFITDLLNDGFDVKGFFDIFTALSPLVNLFKIIKPYLPEILDAFMEIGGLLGGVVKAAFDAIVPVVGVLFEALESLIPVVLEIIQAFLPVIEAILPILGTLIEALAPIVVQLIEAFVPLVEAILPILIPLLELLAMVLPPILTAIVWLIENGVNSLILALDFLMPIIVAVVNMFVDTWAPAIEMVLGMLDGFITFLTGVFTGDWEKTWEGAHKIFDSVWQGIQDIAYGSLNGIIGLINGVIDGINSITQKISDLSGGAIDLTIGHIPEVPRLAEGGIVSRRPGGVMANIGEGRYDEAVVPLSPGVLATLGGTGKGTEVNMTVNPSPGMDEATIGRVAANAISFELRRA